MVDSKWVVATDRDSASTLQRRLQEAWEHLAAKPPSEPGSPRAQLLARPWTDVWQVEESTERRMGIAGNEGEFLIILRDVGAYLADAVVVAAADRLVAEAVEWLKRKYGTDSIKLSDGSDDDK